MGTTKTADVPYTASQNSRSVLCNCCYRINSSACIQQLESQPYSNSGNRIVGQQDEQNCKVDQQDLAAAAAGEVTAVECRELLYQYEHAADEEKLLDVNDDNDDSACWFLSQSPDTDTTLDHSQKAVEVTQPQTREQHLLLPTLQNTQELTQQFQKETKHLQKHCYHTLQALNQQNEQLTRNYQQRDDAQQQVDRPLPMQQQQQDARRAWQLRVKELKIAAGSRVLVVGSNGAGKTTFLNIIGGKKMVGEGMTRVLGREAFFDVSLNRDVSCLSEWWKGDFSLDVPMYELVSSAVETHINAQMRLQLLHFKKLQEQRQEQKGEQQRRSGVQQQNEQLQENEKAWDIQEKRMAALEKVLSAASSSRSNSCNKWKYLFYGAGLSHSLPCCCYCCYRTIRAGCLAKTATSISATATSGDGTREALEEQKKGEVVEIESACVAARLRLLVKSLAVDVRWRIARVSDGQRRRCQLLAALLEKKKLYILDEATADLDILSREALQQLLLYEAKKRNATILYSTHVFDGLEEWASHVLYMRGGRIELYEPLPKLLSSEKHRENEPAAAAPLYSLVRRWLSSEAMQTNQEHQQPRQ